MQGVPNLTVHRLPLKSFRFAHLVRDLAWAPPPSHDCLLACVASGATLSVFRYRIKMLGPLLAGKMTHPNTFMTAAVLLVIID